MSDGTWTFDDANYTTFPRGYKTLVNGQFDYSFDEDFLDVEEAHVLDASGDAIKLRRLDKRDLDIPWNEYFSNASTPEYFDLDGGSIILGPAPASGSVTLTNGLIVHFRRTADIFTSAQVTTGTKEPGFASPHHMILAYMAAIPFCMAYRKDRVPLYMAEVERRKQDLLDYYSRRESDDPDRITMSGQHAR